MAQEEKIIQALKRRQERALKNSEDGFIIFMDEFNSLVNFNRKTCDCDNSVGDVCRYCDPRINKQMSPFFFTNEELATILIDTKHIKLHVGLNPKQHFTRVSIIEKIKSLGLGKGNSNE